MTNFAFARTAPLLAATVSAPKGEGNGVVLHDLRGETPRVVVLHTASGEHAAHPVWAEEAEHLAFVIADDDDGEPAPDAELWVWTGSGEARRVASKGDAPDGFTVPLVNEVEWSRDGARLFFGFKPGSDSDSDSDSDADSEEPFDPYDAEAILEDRKVDVWHWKDPRIIPNQKERWEEHEKDRVYHAVMHLADGAVVALAGLELPEVEPTDNLRFALGRSDRPYLRELTWNGRFADIYVVDLGTGERRLVAERLRGGWDAPSASLSPDGRWIVYYDDGDWHVFDTEEGSARNLTADLPVGFADEEWDYPADPPGYGHAEWGANSEAILIYDDRQ